MEPLIEIGAEVDGFLCGRERQGNVAGMERSCRTAAEAPHQRVRVAEQPRCLDATVQQLAGLGQLPAQAPKPAQSQDEHKKEFAPLSGGARNGECTAGMSVAVGVPTRIELRPSEPGRRLEVAGEVLVRQRIDESHDLLTTGLGTL